MNKKLLALANTTIALAVIAGGAFFFTSDTMNQGLENEDFALETTPWASIGGCGAGGSGGGGGDGIKWLGQGVDGGLVQVEVMPKLNAGQNFQFLTIAPRFQFKPTYGTTMGVTIPWVSKTAEVQHQTDLPANNRTTGGLGDIALDWGTSLGPSGELGITFGLTMPTGQYDIARGTDAAKEFLPANLQKGGGSWGSSFALSWTQDVEDGFWMADLSYSHPFMMRLISQENAHMDEYWQDYKDMKDDERFYYTFKPYGENDLGAYAPPSVSAGYYYAYRGTPGMVYSGGFTFSMPLGVAWIHNKNPAFYDPFPDPDFQKWSGAFVYGMEFSKSAYPVYVAVSLPIHDKSNAPDPSENKYDPSLVDQWDGPDMEDFLQTWTIAVGIKNAMF